MFEREKYEGVVEVVFVANESRTGAHSRACSHFWKRDERHSGLALKNMALAALFFCHFAQVWLWVLFRQSVVINAILFHTLKPSRQRFDQGEPQS